MSVNTSILKNTILVTLIGSVTQILGFTLTVLISWRFGVNITTDAYYFAMAFPIFFVNVASGIVKMVFIPVFIEEKIKNPSSAKSMIESTIFIFIIGSLVGMVLISVVLLCGINSLSRESSQSVIEDLIFILLPVIPFGMLFALFSGIYNSYQKFGLSESSLAIKSLLAIGFLLFLSNQLGIYSVAIGQVASSLVSLLMVCWVVTRQLQVSLRPRWSPMPGVKRMLRLSALPVISYVIFQLNPVTARFILAQLPVGSVSILSYAERLAAIPSLIIGTGFTTVLLSHWAVLAAEGNRQGLQQSLNRVITLLIMLLFPLVTALVILREPIVTIAYQRGAFDEAATVATADVFCVLSMQHLPMFLHMVTVRILLVENAMRTLFWLNLLSAILNLMLMTILGPWLGLGVIGLALGMVLSTTAIMLITAFIVHRRFTAFSISTLVESTSKVMFATILMGLAVVAIERALTPFLAGLEVLQILATAMCGFLSYLLGLRIVRHPEFESLNKFLRSRSQLLIWSRGTS
jgi:putative peptidoglycan lipid II flippase